MRKYLIIAGLFFTLIISGQPTGIMASQDVTSVACTQNLVKYSEQIDNAYWLKSTASVTDTDCANDLEGNATMDEITTTGVEHNTYSYDGASYCDVTASTTYRWSFDVIKGTMTDLKWSVYNQSSFAEIVSPTSYFADIGETVTRVSLEFSTPVGCTKVRLYFIRDSGVTGTVYIGRAQLEENGSCYIETTNTTITP